MKVLLFSVLVISISFASANSDSFTLSNECFEKDNENDAYCLVTAKWNVDNGSSCFISEYYKGTVSLTDARQNDTLNGTAQCTKTPCDVTEKISVDCATAFGAKLVGIEKK